MDEHTKTVNSVAAVVDRAGQLRIVSGGYDCKVFCWSPDTDPDGKQVLAFNAGTKVIDLSIEPKTGQIAAALGPSGILLLEIEPLCRHKVD